MARRRQREIPPCSKTYGFPIYCAAWVPMDRISSAAAEEEAAGKKKEGEGEAAAVEETAEKKEQGGGGEVVVAEEEGVKKKEQEGGQSFQALDPNRLLVALGGGGGEGRSGVPNVLLIAEFDLISRSLSDTPVFFFFPRQFQEPYITHRSLNSNMFFRISLKFEVVFRLRTDADVPYRMAVHPGGDGVVCAFPKSCRCQKLSSSCQISVTISWFNWDVPESKETYKLALKSSAKILTPLEDVGLQLALAFDAEGSILATGGEVGNFFLVDITPNSIRTGNQAKLVSWDSLSWKRVGERKKGRDPISAFNVSMDGKHLAV
ncbi:hypothetical protein BHM03_00001948 [Ensete ventricosum]|nr:hypothetical protein BHM03_00001948 [Ensete ventricosum]